jgi:hypothetical protein
MICRTCSSSRSRFNLLKLISNFQSYLNKYCPEILQTERVSTTQWLEVLTYCVASFNAVNCCFSTALMTEINPPKMIAGQGNDQVKVIIRSRL